MFNEFDSKNLNLHLTLRLPVRDVVDIPHMAVHSFAGDELCTDLTADLRTLDSVAIASGLVSNIQVTMTTLAERATGLVVEELGLRRVLPPTVDAGMLI